MRDYEGLSRKHFNQQAAVYDEKNTVYYSREGKISCRNIAEYLRDKEWNSLLDVGCGTGWLIDLLRKGRMADYHGLDLAENMIEVAVSKNIPDAQFVVGKADELPYDNNRFDVVTCSQSFHHYPNQNAAMAEAYRVLKKGGLYILSDTGIGGVGAWLDNHIFFKLAPGGDCFTQNRKSIAKRMQRAGFTVIDCVQLQGIIYRVIGKKKHKKRPERSGLFVLIQHRVRNTEEDALTRRDQCAVVRRDAVLRHGCPSAAVDQLRFGIQCALRYVADELAVQ